MNGPQDLGGQMGFGPVAAEAGEPVFHADWERRALALTMALRGAGVTSLDASRHARESLHPAVYYAASYYEIWTRALERQLVELGVVTPEELAAGRARGTPHEPVGAMRPGDFAAAAARGASFARDPGDSTPAFAAGDRVRTRVMHPRGHTRLPRYARGKAGRVEAMRGFHVFPDAHAHGRGEAPQWLYTVLFDAAELWGPEADPRGRVSIDAWESYLERA